MLAIVGKAVIRDRELPSRCWRGQVVPRVSRAGFVAGYWTKKDNTGLSMVIFDSETADNGRGGQVRSMVDDSVAIEDVEVREVVAHA